MGDENVHYLPPFAPREADDAPDLWPHVIDLNYLQPIRHEYHETYKAVKAFYMAIGNAYSVVFAASVGGTVAPLKAGGCDVVTDLGSFEFKSGDNTANKAGAAHDQLRCPGRCVQVTGAPKKGWMSGVKFLAIHGIDDPVNVARSLQTEAFRRVSQFGTQGRLF